MSIMCFVVQVAELVGGRLEQLGHCRAGMINLWFTEFQFSWTLILVCLSNKACWDCDWILGFMRFTLFICWKACWFFQKPSLTLLAGDTCFVYCIWTEDAPMIWCETNPDRHKMHRVQKKGASVEMNCNVRFPAYNHRCAPCIKVLPLPDHRAFKFI